MLTAHLVTLLPLLLGTAVVVEVPPAPIPEPNQSTSEGSNAPVIVIPPQGENNTAELLRLQECVTRLEEREGQRETRTAELEARLLKYEQQDEEEEAVVVAEVVPDVPPAPPPAAPPKKERNILHRMFLGR